MSHSGEYVNSASNAMSALEFNSIAIGKAKVGLNHFSVITVLITVINLA